MGESVELTWSASAFPFIKSVSWQHIPPEGETRRLDIDQQKYTRSNQNHLVINKTSKADEGEYVCTVSDWCGRRRSATTKVMVEGDNPTVEILGKYTVILGESVELTWSASAFPFIKSVSWQHISPEEQTRQLDIDKQKYTRSNQNHLVINKTSKADEGEYVCTVSDWCGRRRSATTKVMVEGDNPTVEILENDTVVLGESVELTWSASAFPFIKSVSWQHIPPDGETRRLDIDQQKYTRSNRNPLVINKTSKADEGEYVCTVSDWCGRRRSATTKVMVEGDNPTVEILEKYTVILGEKVELTWSAFAFPFIKSVLWQRISPEEQTRQLDIDQQKYTRSKQNHLVINKTSKADEGEYVCTVSDWCGRRRSATTKVMVEGGPPELNMNPPIHNKTEGEDVILKCKVVAIPSPSTATWTKGGRDIAIDDDKYYMGNLPTPSLIINNMNKLYDEGEYTCEAKNSAGKGSKSVHLLIHVARTPKDTETNEPTQDAMSHTQIKLIHADMVNRLANYFYPEARYWQNFVTTVSAYLDPKQLEGSLQHIVANLLMKKHIKIGQYKILYDVVHNIDVTAAPFIEEAESKIKAMREKGTYASKDTPAEVVQKYEGNAQPNLSKHLERQIAKELPDAKDRLTVTAAKGSIALTFTLSEAKTPHQLSALYLADTLRTRLQSRKILLEDESHVPLERKTTPTVRIPTDNSKDTPTRPIVRLSRRHYRFEKGTDAIVKCVVVDPHETRYVEWFRGKDDGNFNAIPIDNNKFFRGSPEFPSLVISDLNTEDRGIYFCKIGNTEGEEAESNMAFVEINVTEVPAVEIQENYTVVIGESVELTWSASAFPSIVEISWQHISPEGQTRQLDIDKQKYTSPNPNCLVINNTSKTDEGEYVCTISDLCERRLCATTRLMVEGGLPVVKIDHNAYTVAIGQTVTLGCTVSATPTHTNVFWQRIYNVVATTLTIDRTKYSGSTIDNPSLTITSAGSDDLAVYTCSATNAVGTGTSGQTTLTGLPVVNIDQNSYTVITGQTVTLGCTVSATPAHTDVFWQRIDNGKATRLTIGGTKYSGSTVENPSLTITSAGSDDLAVYTCSATNTLGTGTSGQTTLTETMKVKKLKEKFLPTKSLENARGKLLKNRIVIIKGNAGDGKTSIALELIRSLCNDEKNGEQKQCRQSLELHNIKDLDLVKPSSQLVICIDDIFGKNVLCESDVEAWQKREKSVLAILDGKDHTEANFLVITIQSDILNSLNDSWLEQIFTEQNIVDLNQYIDKEEKLVLLRLYEPKDQFISWKDDEEKEIVKCSPDIGFPQCCRLFRDTPTLHTERVNFFRSPFQSLLKLEDGTFYALLYLFLNGGKVMKKDLDPYNETIDKTLEAAFAVDVVKVTRRDEFKTKEGRLEFVKESLEYLLGWVVKKKHKQKPGFPSYKFNHDSVEETVALLYGEKTPIGYIENCPTKYLSYITTSKTTPNRIVISSKDQTNVMYTRLVKEFEFACSDPISLYPYDYITSLDVWTDTQFLQGFIRWPSFQNGDSNICNRIKLALLNEACSSGAEKHAIFFLSEGVEPDKDTPFCVIKGGSMYLLHKLLKYDITRTARGYMAQSSFSTNDINVIHQACWCEREEMVTVLCDTYPHLVHGTGTWQHSPLHYGAKTGNCGLFHTVERTFLKSKCRGVRQNCESVDGRVVHRSCVCAQYMSELVDNYGRTVLHWSCLDGHRGVCLYFCESYPTLTTIVDESGKHCLHTIATISDVDMFTECEARVKQYLESTGREYDITNIRDNEGLTVLHMSCAYGNRKLCKYLYEAYPALTTIVEKSGIHCLHFMVHGASDVDMFTECETHVKQYVESTGHEYDITAILDSKGHTVLHWSCERGLSWLCMYLVKAYPALTTIVDKSGRHCLHYIAKFTSDVDMFTECESHIKRYLEATGHEYDITTILDGDGCTVLHRSCESGHSSICIYLAETYPSLTTIVDKSGRHCLHYIAMFTSDVDLFTECESHVKRYLEATGREYDITTILDSEGCTVLHRSCESNRRWLCIYLAEAYPSLTTIVDKLGRHCLHYIAAKIPSDVHMFTECETRVKQYLESTGCEYDITAILTNNGESVLDLFQESTQGWVGGDIYSLYVILSDSFVNK